MVDRLAVAEPPILESLLPEELAARAEIPLEGARRLFSRLHRRGALPAVAPATIRRRSLERARAAGESRDVTVVSEQRSALDPFVKYAFTGADDRAFETVRIPLEKPGRFSVCVSSQVGCAMGCTFCATGTMGLVRNLEVWEIVAQVRAVSLGLPPGSRCHGVVFQGMGEPLSNTARVLQAIRVLSEPSGLAIDQRNITVCTSGLIPGIVTLAESLPNVRLGVSIGDARPERRREVMPIDATYPLSEVLAAVGRHARASGYAPMWAYTLLAGKNDDEQAAQALAARALAFASEFGVRPRLSLIPYNRVESAEGVPLPFERSEDEVVSRFRETLLAAGLGSIVRYSGGGDIGAACGQLVRLGARGKQARPHESVPSVVDKG
jgi:23S rRNA (adenine2503-C2)-methyltransferase